MKANICLCAMMAVTVSMNVTSAVPPQSPARSAYIASAGQLSGFVGQIHRFFSACGERLGKAQTYREHEEGWMRTNVELEQGYRTALARPRSWMSPAQVTMVEEIDRQAYEATMTVLKEQNEMTANATCTAFLQRMDSTENMRLVSTQFLEPFLAAHRELDNAERPTK